MGWTTPATTTAGQLVTAAFWNQQIRDELNYLKGNAGAVVVSDTLSFGNAAQLRGHRHPYANERHIESGTASQGVGTDSSGNTFAITFADAFTVAPRVLATSDGVNGQSVVVASALSISTTGFTLKQYHDLGVTVTPVLFWIAEGQD